MDKRKSALIHAAIAGVLAAGTTLVTTSAKADVNCYGVNSCKGTGACGSKTTGASCAGSNACKGKGFLKVKDEAECKAKNGSLTEVTTAAKKEGEAAAVAGKAEGDHAKAKGKKAKAAAKKAGEATKGAADDAKKAVTSPTTP